MAKVSGLNGKDETQKQAGPNLEIPPSPTGFCRETESTAYVHTGRGLYKGPGLKAWEPGEPVV